jgi:hypothetical protein
MLTSIDRDEDFRKPVRRLAATVTYGSGARCDVVLFCQPGEDLSRLLAADEPFLPIEQEGKVRLVARKELAVVSVPFDGEFEEEATLTRRVTVAVRLTSGAQVEGELAYTPRPGRPRVLDFLNEPDATLRLLDTHATHHVSKAHIHAVEER